MPIQAGVETLISRVRREWKKAALLAAVVLAGCSSAESKNPTPDQQALLDNLQTTVFQVLTQVALENPTGTASATGTTAPSSTPTETSTPTPPPTETEPPATETTTPIPTVTPFPDDDLTRPGTLIDHRPHQGDVAPLYPLEYTALSVEEKADQVLEHAEQLVDEAAEELEQTGQIDEDNTHVQILMADYVPPTELDPTSPEGLGMGLSARALEVVVGERVSQEAMDDPQTELVTVGISDEDRKYALLYHQPAEGNNPALLVAGTNLENSARFEGAQTEALAMVDSIFNEARIDSPKGPFADRFLEHLANLTSSEWVKEENSAGKPLPVSHRSCEINTAPEGSDHVLTIHEILELVREQGFTPEDTAGQLVDDFGKAHGEGPGSMAITVNMDAFREAVDAIRNAGQVPTAEQVFQIMLENTRVLRTQAQNRGEHVPAGYDQTFEVFIPTGYVALDTGELIVCDSVLLVPGATYTVTPTHTPPRVTVVVTVPPRTNTPPVQASGTPTPPEVEKTPTRPAATDTPPPPSKTPTVPVSTPTRTMTAPPPTPTRTLTPPPTSTEHIATNPPTATATERSGDTGTPTPAETEIAPQTPTNPVPTPTVPAATETPIFSSWGLSDEELIKTFSAMHKSRDEETI